MEIIEQINLLDSFTVNKFEEIWIYDNVTNAFNEHSLISKHKELSDSEYILYVVWTQLNDERLYNQYKADTIVISGSMNRTDKIIFHGGCITCKSQTKHGIERCKGCLYFKFIHHMPDLSIRENYELTEPTALEIMQSVQ